MYVYRHTYHVYLRISSSVGGTASAHPEAKGLSERNLWSVMGT